MVFKTEAIVLRERVLRGPDRMYDVLTPHDGKLSVIGRSTARSSSKLAGFLQPLAHVKMMIGRGSQDHAAGVATIENYTPLRQTLFDFLLAISLVELVVRINVPGVYSAIEFDLLRTVLDLMVAHRTSKRNKVLISRIFLWKLLSLSGWKPDVSYCALCRKALINKNSMYFSPKGFVCNEHGEKGINIDSELAVFLEMIIANNDWHSMIAHAQSKNIEEQWRAISTLYYQDVLGYQLQSLKLFSYV